MKVNTLTLKFEWKGQTFLLLFFSLFGFTAAWNVYIDKDTDVFMNWDLDGDYTYYGKGDQLTILQEFLPSDFDFKAFHHTVGIWSIIPEQVDDNKINSISNVTVTTSATFSFHSSAQLLAFVTVTYCMRGDARIYIKKDLNGETIFTIDPTESPGYKWTVMQVPIDMSNRFVVEAVVRGPKDYIFIDRIEGSYLETTTTTTTRRTTTTTTTTLPPSTTKTTTISTSTSTSSTTSKSAPTTSPPTPTANPIVSQGNSKIINPAFVFFFTVILYLYFSKF